MESIVQHEKVCFLCGRNGNTDPLEEHHIFNASNRSNSEKYGLKVWLCGNRCHRNGADAAHRSRETADRLKAIGQAEFEKTHTRHEFIKIFGRSYL